MSTETDASAVADVVTGALEVVQALESNPDPHDPTTRQIVSSFFGTLQKPYSEEDTALILNHPVLNSIKRDLLEKYSSYITETEQMHTVKFLEDPALSYSTFSGYFDWSHYERILHLEMAILKQSTNSRTFLAGESLAFVGSGPLPLSAIIIAVEFRIPVTCIDYDLKACDTSRVLLSRLHLTDVCKVVHTSGQQHDYGNNPVVMIASMVPGRIDVLRQIKSTRSSGFVMIRSSGGARNLLYEPVDEPAIEGLGLTYLQRTALEEGIANSTLIFSF